MHREKEIFLLMQTWKKMFYFHYPTSDFQRITAQYLLQNLQIMGKLLLYVTTFVKEIF